MGRRKNEALIQYRQGIFSRIKNTIVNLFNTDDKENANAASIGHDRLHDVLMQDRINNHDVRITNKQNDNYAKTPKENIIKDQELKQIEQREVINEITSNNNSINLNAQHKKYIDENKSSKSDIDELLEVLDILQNNKIDTKKIKTFKNVNKHRKSTILTDINQQNADINKIITENNLSSDYPIGRKIELARRRINNLDKYRREITNDQVTQLEKFGVIK